MGGGGGKKKSSRCRSACRLRPGRTGRSRLGSTSAHSRVRRRCRAIQVSSVPWMPAPSKIPIQRALIGFDGPGGIVPASEPRPRRSSERSRRVHFLFLDVVQALRRFEPFLADRDGIGLVQLQVLPEPQREGRAVEGEVGGVLGGDLAAVTSGLTGCVRAAMVWSAWAFRTAASSWPVSRSSRSLRPYVGRNDVEFVAARFDGGVPRFAVDPRGDPTDEPIDRRLGIGDLRRDVLVDLAAAQIADDPPGQRPSRLAANASSTAASRSAWTLRLLPEDPVLAVVADTQGMPQRRQQLRADRALCWLSRVMPPTSTPPIVTPSAIWSCCEPS